MVNPNLSKNYKKNNGSVVSGGGCRGGWRCHGCGDGKFASPPVRDSHRLGGRPARYNTDMLE